MVQLVSRYSNALLSIISDEDAFKTSLKQAEFVRDTLDHNEIRNFLDNPEVPNAEKRNLMKKSFGDDIDQNLMGFLDLMIRKSRESLIIPVLTDLIHQIKNTLGKVEAYLVSAIPLSEEEELAVARILSDKLGVEVEVESSVDRDLLAGFYVQVNGQVFDSSLRTDIQRITSQLKKGDFRDS
ncbi:ATP synthase F1 subunit delta [Aerococcaceae bacterium WGS1372]